jgi:hypothetical protein
MRFESACGGDYSGRALRRLGLFWNRGAEEADFEAGVAEEGGGFGVDDEKRNEADAGDEGEETEEDANAGAIEFGAEEEDEDGGGDADGEECDGEENALVWREDELRGECCKIGEDAQNDGALANGDFADAGVALSVAEGFRALGRAGGLSHGVLRV